MVAASPGYIEQAIAVQPERKIADEIMQTVTSLELPLKLDQLTEGLGNCFPIAITQQCKRPEINKEIKLSLRMALMHHRAHAVLRHLVRKFITKSEHPNIARFKAQYEELESNISRETWSQYWQRMEGDRVWGDFWFVHATAWYIGRPLDCRLSK